MNTKKSGRKPRLNAAIDGHKPVKCRVRKNNKEVFDGNYKEQEAYHKAWREP